MNSNNKLNNNKDFSHLKNIIYDLWKQVKVNLFQNLEVEKKSWKELVTWLDKMIETEARRLISAKFWKVNYVWEELDNEDTWSEITFIIDPLDWTESFINRDFNTVISIWVKLWDKLVYWVVYDFMKDILYEGDSDSNMYFQNNKIPFFRENYSDKIRILISWRNDIKEVREKLEQHSDLRITRAYWSVALQIAQTWAWNYDWYVRAWKIKLWDIAWITPFITWISDTQLLSRDWNTFDYDNPEDWVIVVRKNFQDRFLEMIN